MNSEKAMLKNSVINYLEDGSNNFCRAWERGVIGCTKFQGPLLASPSLE